MASKNACHFQNVTFLQILQLDEGDTLELKMLFNFDSYISDITLNIEFIGLGFDCVF